MSELKDLWHELGVKIERTQTHLENLPKEILDWELQVLSKQDEMDNLKRNDLEDAKLFLQQAQFEASAVAYGLDIEDAVVRGRNAEIRKIELGRYLSQDTGLIEAQDELREVADRLAQLNSEAQHIGAHLHNAQNQLKANFYLAAFQTELLRILGGKNE